MLTIVTKQIVLFSKFNFANKLNHINHRSFPLAFNHHLYWCRPSFTLFILLYTALYFRSLQEDFF